MNQGQDDSFTAMIRERYPLMSGEDIEWLREYRDSLETLRAGVADANLSSEEYALGFLPLLGKEGGL